MCYKWRVELVTRRERDVFIEVGAERISVSREDFLVPCDSRHTRCNMSKDARIVCES